MRSTPVVPLSQRGVSLVEISMALAIVGVATIALLHTVGGTRVREHRAMAETYMHRSEGAVLSFLAIHHRFPCPAAEADGLETCDGRTEGVLPHATLGLPGTTPVPIRYALDPVAAAGKGRFMVLVNDQEIGPSGAPRAAPVALANLLGEQHDGMLDVCEDLSHVAAKGEAAYTLTQETGDAPALGGWTGSPAHRAMDATRVASHLGCQAMVSVAGRGQYNAHLAAAIMSKAALDRRQQSEVAYAIHYWDLAEGIWSFSNGMYASMKNWAKLLQTSSALDANIWSNPGPFVALNARAIVDRAVELVGVAARLSNLVRYSRNLKLAQDNREAENRLVRKTLEIYASTTRHALMGSASAYFLREQEQVGTWPAAPGPASDHGPSELAQDLVKEGEIWATILDHGELLSPFSQLPAGPGSTAGAPVAP